MGNSSPHPFASINRAAVPEWALNRAKEITGCGWTIATLRAVSNNDSYAYTIYKVALHVMETEEDPAKPLYEGVLGSLEHEMRGLDLCMVRGWPGTVTIARAITTDLFEAGFRQVEEPA